MHQGVPYGHSSFLLQTKNMLVRFAAESKLPSSVTVHAHCKFLPIRHITAKLLCLNQGSFFNNSIKCIYLLVNRHPYFINSFSMSERKSALKSKHFFYLRPEQEE